VFTWPGLILMEKLMFVLSKLHSHEARVYLNH
jgi:hypothetical protein